VGQWLEELINSVDDQVLVMLCGNKADLEENRQVSQDLAKKFAKVRSTPVPSHQIKSLLLSLSLSYLMASTVPDYYLLWLTLI